MKKVIAAGIKQVLEFDSIEEMYRYIGQLRHRMIKHRCLHHEAYEDGRVRLWIIKAYNDNTLIED